MKDSNVKCKFVNLLVDNIRENLQDLGPSKVLWDITPNTQSIKK